MTTIVAATGLLIDRGFPGLSEDAARQRRSMTISGLVKLVTLATTRNAEAIIIVGGLFDESTLGVENLRIALEIVDSFGGQVFIAPGAKDPVSAGGTYATTHFPPRVTVWRDARFDASHYVGSVAIAGSASPGGWDDPLPIALNSDELLLVVAETIRRDLIEPENQDAAPLRHIITTGHQDSTADVTYLEPVNADIGSPFGGAAVITIEEGAFDHEFVPLLEGAGISQSLDVSSATSTRDLSRAVLRAASSMPDWSLLHLTGVLAQGVQLPTTTGIAAGRDQILIDEAGLEFAFADADPSDRSAQAEFIRSVIGSRDVSDRDRHQAIAVGTAALSASDDESGTE